MNPNTEEMQKEIETFNDKYKALVEETGYFYMPSITTGEDGTTLKLVMQIFKKNNESVS